MLFRSCCEVSLLCVYVCGSACVDLAAAGRREAQGCGTEGSMAYPGHPGAGGGGYYAGGVSAARPGSRPGCDPWTPGAPRGHTWRLRGGGSRAPPPCQPPRPGPLPTGLCLQRPLSLCPFSPRLAARGRGTGGFDPRSPPCDSRIRGVKSCTWGVAFLSAFPESNSHFNLEWSWGPLLPL